MDKFGVARLLSEIASYLELSDPNPFRARAFDKAARAVETLDRDLGEMVKSGELLKVPGIGKATGEAIAEILAKGKSAYLDELRASYPPGIFELMRVPNLGLRKIGTLHSELGIGSLDELEAAARDGRIAALRGFGPKTAAYILEGVEVARMRETKFLLPVGIEIAESLRERLALLPEVEEVEVSGSVRRRLEVIHNVNLVLATRKPAAVARRLPALVSDLSELEGHTWKGRARNEIDVFFHVVAPAEFGTALLRTTGSADFVAALQERSPLTRNADEKELFKALGVPFVEPERRETGEDVGRRRRARLVTTSNLRGTFHVHTTFSDGRNSVGEMLAAARRRRWEYVGISDHSPAAHYAGGLSEERLREQHAEIAKAEKGVAPMRVFRGTEADILRNGAIDYGPGILARLDFVVASVHSSFKLEKDEMTARMLRALDDPNVTFLGHLTGRLLLARPGYSIDFDAVFDRAAERGVIIEINGNPRRLELDWRLLRRAADRGVVFSIHPDAHSIAEYEAVISGTWVARKGGLSAKEVFNTRNLEEVAEWLAERKRRRPSGAAHG